MQVLNKDEVNLNKDQIFHILRTGTFVYPTDTIYGIGCDATNQELVQKVREIKNRPHQPFSIIAPNKNWIKTHCVLTQEAEEWIEKLPGPYTLILKLKKESPVAQNVNLGMDTLGVRMPNHWIQNLVNEYGKPIITTSANASGENFMTSLDDLTPQVKKEVPLIIYDGEIKGRPSTLVHLSEEKVTLQKR
ncbi:threonylcarbamoyl-AMP synthase [Candidatus Woesearchaeota archaeon]|nr:threonylcarbamoyl-AMP synthase [Candidatus Woesearchaeota archaeon]